MSHDEQLARASKTPAEQSIGVRAFRALLTSVWGWASVMSGGLIAGPTLYIAYRAATGAPYSAPAWWTLLQALGAVAFLLVVGRQWFRAQAEIDRLHGKIQAMQSTVAAITQVTVDLADASSRKFTVSARVYTGEETAFHDDWTIEFRMATGQKVRAHPGEVVADHRFPAGQRSTLGIRFDYPPALPTLGAVLGCTIVRLWGTDIRARTVAFDARDC